MNPVSPPSLASYNERATARRLATGSGAALVFVPPDEMTLGYERRAYARGEIVTRPDNWHDAYNAEVWLEFPRSKAALNGRHIDAMAHESDGKRGRLRDRFTQFDECGIVITGMRQDLWHVLCAHRWREVFVTHRDEIMTTTRFHVFGHASRDALRAPFFGLCGKAIWLEGDFSTAAALDAALACRLTATDFRAPFQPLPLLGIPGVTPENEDPAYYDDVRQFRPARTIRAGSSLGNR